MLRVRPLRVRLPKRLRAREWSLGQRVTALSLVVGAVLGSIAVATGVSATENNRNVNTVLDWFGQIRSNVEQLVAAVVNEEAGAETYILSGDTANLDRYTANTQAFIRLSEATARLVDGRDEHLEDGLRRVRDLELAWRQNVAEPAIGQVRADGPDSAGAAKAIERLRAGMRGVTDALESLQQEQRDHRAALARQTEASGRMLAVLLFCAAAVVLVSGLLLIALLRRWVTRPIVDMAEEVRRVARGEYEHEIHGEGAPELVSLARDVSTMRKRIVTELAEVRVARRQIEAAHAQLEQQAQELTRSNRDLEQFAYVASHDLQEPLRKVSSFCQLLQRRYAGQLDERADQYIAFAVDGALRMQRLINDLLAFSRIGRITTGFADVDLNKVIRDTVGQVASQCRDVDGRITWERLPAVHGEEPLLLALITNLVSNSLKFHRPDVPPRVHVSARRVDGGWEISCQDNGIGIAPAFADKVFVIFQRLHARDAYPGTGIGLAIAKKIVEYHGGQVWVDKEYEDGALIRFTLPAAASSTAPVPAAPAAAAPAGSPAAALELPPPTPVEESVG